MIEHLPYYAQFFIVIFIMTVVDICWAMYFIKTSEKKPFPAAIWGLLITLLGAISITSYMHDKSLIIAGCIGAFIGTYGTVWWEKMKK